MKTFENFIYENVSTNKDDWFFSIQHNELEKVKDMIKYIHATDNQNNTGLYYAIFNLSKNSNLEMIDFLIIPKNYSLNGADINHKNIFSKSLLHLCITNNKIPELETLLKYTEEIDIIQFNKLDINILNKYDQTPLLYLAYDYAFSKQSTNGKKQTELDNKMLDLLIKKDADWNLKDNEGNDFFDLMQGKIIHNKKTIDELYPEQYKKYLKKKTIKKFKI